MKLQMRGLKREIREMLRERREEPDEKLLLRAT